MALFSGTAAVILPDEDSQIAAKQDVVTVVAEEITKEDWVLSRNIK